MESCCPLCTELFCASDAFRHLLNFHADPKPMTIWQCGDCFARGSFDDLAQHCFRVGHASGRMKLRRAQQLEHFPALLQNIQDKMQNDPGDQRDQNAKDELSLSLLSDNTTEVEDPDAQEDFRDDANYDVAVFKANPALASSDKVMGKPSFPEKKRASENSTLRNRCQKKKVIQTSTAIHRYPGKAAAWKCNQCSSAFTSAYLLKRHGKTVHDGRKPLKCSDCDYSGAKAYKLKRHYNAVHLGRKPFKCSECTFTTAEANDLKRHYNAIHLGRKPFKCSECTFTAAEANGLKRHYTAVHLGKKPFKCSECDYSAATAYNLKRHNNAVHVREVRFKCSSCAYATTTADNLRLHKGRNHVVN